MDQAVSKRWTRFKSGINFFFGIIGLLIGLISLYVSWQYAEISYSASTVKVVSQREVGPSIKITSATGEIIDADVYVTDLIIWNSGNQSIEKERIRSPLTINIDNEVLQIEKSKEVTQAALFELVHVADAPNARSLDWKFFDPDYGVRIVIVTAGNQPPNIGLKGELYGVNFVSTRYTSPTMGNWFKAALPIVMIPLLAVMFLFADRMNSREIKLANEDPNAFAQRFIDSINRRRPWFYGLFAIILLVLLFLGWGIWKTSVPSMPAEL